MPTYLCTDHNTQIVVFDDGGLEMRQRSPSMDGDGGVGFDWRTVARFMLVDTTLSPDKFCPDFDRFRMVPERKQT